MRSSHLVAASPRFGSLNVPPSPRYTPHASPAFGPSSHRHRGHASTLQHSLSLVMWHASPSGRSCSHVVGGIDERACRATVRKPDSWCCEACETSNGVRMCLACGSCACERHSYAHFEAHSSGAKAGATDDDDNGEAHSLWMQLNDEKKSVYCYTCRVLVQDDNAEHNIKHIRDVLEDVQTLNVDILSKTTRSGRRRMEVTAGSAAATAASSIPVAAPSSDVGDVAMTDVDADSDALPPIDPRLSLSASTWQRVKSWHKVMPFLSRKAQAARRKEDQLRTCLFRWRNRALISCFMSWKFAMRTGREERLNRRATATDASTSKRTTRSSMHPPGLDDLPMMSFDLRHLSGEGTIEETSEPEDEPETTEASLPVTRRTRLSAGPTLPSPPPAPEREVRKRGRPKRSRSEERHLPVPSPTSTRSRATKAADDMISPKADRLRRTSASARVSPKGSRCSSPKPGAKGLKGSGAIKLAPGVMGLRNLGNTCYMNSVIQCFSLTDLFKSYYVEVIPTLLPPLVKNEKKMLNSRAAKHRKKPSSASASPASDDESDEDSDDEEDHSSLSRDVADLLSTIWRGQRVVFTPDHALQTVWTLYERFKGFKQQDAQEFVMFLLNQLSKEQETQLPQQKLEERFRNPALERARAEIKNPTAPVATERVLSGGAIGSARKRKKDPDSGSKRNNQSQSTQEDDGDETMDGSQPSSATRRRSHRSTTIISTTSSNSMAHEAAHHTTSSSSSSGATAGSSSSTYAVPLPPSSLASVELHPPPEPSFSVARLIVSRPHDFIVQNFSGVLRSEIKCTVCSRVSASESDFLGMLSVQIPTKGFLEGEEEHDHATSTPPGTQPERHASIHHSTSSSQLAGGSSSSASLNANLVAPSTFLSVSRSLSHSRSEQTLSAGSHASTALPSSSATAGADSVASISARNRARHDKSSFITLQQCLAFTFNSGQPEVMDGPNAYSCGGCKKKVRAEKHQYLFIHVGRTVYDMTTFSSKKDQTHIAFPLHDLDLAPYLSPSTGAAATTARAHGGYQYDLYAVVTHHGRGLNEGHFTCFGHSAEQDCWLLFNDARVSVVPPEKVQESQAYLLFYKRKEAKG